MQGREERAGGTGQDGQSRMKRRLKWARKLRQHRGCKISLPVPAATTPGLSLTKPCRHLAGDTSPDSLKSRSCAKVQLGPGTGDLQDKRQRQMYRKALPATVEAVRWRQGRLCCTAPAGRVWGTPEPPKTSLGTHQPKLSLLLRHPEPPDPSSQEKAALGQLLPD